MICIVLKFGKSEWNAECAHRRLRHDFRSQLQLQIWTSINKNAGQIPWSQCYLKIGHLQNIIGHQWKIHQQLLPQHLRAGQLPHSLIDVMAFALVNQFRHRFPQWSSILKREPEIWSGEMHAMSKATLETTTPTRISCYEKCFGNFIKIIQKSSTTHFSIHQD